MVPGCSITRGSRKAVRSARLTKEIIPVHTEIVLQLSFRRRRRHRHGWRLKAPASLADLNPGEKAVVARIELPPPEAARLMELGFIPGAQVEAAGCAPGGDPLIFRVDGAEIALRADTAAQLKISAPGGVTGDRA